MRRKYQIDVENR